MARIHLVGPLSDVRPLLQCADGYLLTSTYEGTPIGALEAFEAGLPIILNNFDGAEALTSVHPCSLLIGKQSLKGTARRIEDLLSRFERDDLSLAAQTRAVWAARWSPAIFERNVRAVVSVLLTSKGSVRDAPTPRPDHRNNEADPPLAPQPHRTIASPSAENE